MEAQPETMSNATTASHYSARFRIPYHEPGPDGLIGIVPLANYLQQAAGEHAEQLGVGSSQLAEKGLFWVLTRQYICIEALPGGGEEIAVETWPSRQPRQLFFRDFRVTGQNSALLATATSTWALIEGRSRRAVRGPAWLIESIRHDGASATTFPARSISRSDAQDIEHDLECAIHPRWSDLDTNGHVNNADLMGYLIEPVARRAVGARRLAAIDAVFRAECGLDHAVSARAGEIAPGHFHHTLLRSGETEVARAETKWV